MFNDAVLLSREAALMVAAMLVACSTVGAIAGWAAGRWSRR